MNGLTGADGRHVPNRCAQGRHVTHVSGHPLMGGIHGWRHVPSSMQHCTGTDSDAWNTKPRASHAAIHRALGTVALGQPHPMGGHG